MDKQRVVIISSGQPSANPRAVKEAVLLSKRGFEVKFIYCPLSPWADAFDKTLFEDNPLIKWISVGYHPFKKQWGYRFARIRKRIYNAIGAGAKDSALINVRAAVLFSQELTAEAARHSADLFIAHNLGALPAAIKAAKKYGAKAGFDAEDFHRGEFHEGDLHVKICAAIENKYFPKLDYCTVASPLIGKAYKEIFPSMQFIVINNVFTLEALQELQHRDKDGLDLFWFSQFIGKGRGLENVIEAINICGKEDIRLHLLGNIKNDYKNHLAHSSSFKNIFFLPPVAPNEIFPIAANFDIGIAGEIPETPNRDLCLTNKIFTYLLGGNGLLLSNTKAQENFLQQYPGVGLLYSYDDPESLAGAILKIYINKSLMLNMKITGHNIAKEELNWEMEGEKFLAIIESL